MSRLKKPLLSSSRNLLLGVLTTVIFLSACKSKDRQQPGTATTAAPNFKLNCVILDKASIQKWVDRGWTDPTKPDSLIKKILLQLYSPDAASANNNIQLATFPAKNYTTVYVAGRANATIDTTCTALMPTGKILFSNNYLKLSALNITDTNGRLRDFSFIRLRPVQDRTYGEYITFAWEVVKIGADNIPVILGSGDTSDPCPSYCEESGE